MGNGMRKGSKVMLIEEEKEKKKKREKKKSTNTNKQSLPPIDSHTVRLDF